MDTKEEYEIIPLSPLRRLEKRIERLESYSMEDPKSIFRDIMDIIKMNQAIVDELARSNDALRMELSKLAPKLDELLSNINELIVYIKHSAEEETGGLSQETTKPIVEKLDELVKQNKTLSEKNESVLEVLEEISKKLKRTTTHLPRPVVRPPVLGPPVPMKKKV